MKKPERTLDEVMDATTRTLEAIMQIIRQDPDWQKRQAEQAKRG